MNFRGRCLGQAGGPEQLYNVWSEGRKMRCYSLGFEGFRVFGLEAVVELGWWQDNPWMVGLFLLLTVWLFSRFLVC